MCTCIACETAFTFDISLFLSLYLNFSLNNIMTNISLARRSHIAYTQTTLIHGVCSLVSVVILRNVHRKPISRKNVYLRVMREETKTYSHVHLPSRHVWLFFFSMLVSERQREIVRERERENIALAHSVHSHFCGVSNFLPTPPTHCCTNGARSFIFSRILCCFVFFLCYYYLPTMEFSINESVYVYMLSEKRTEKRRKRVWSSREQREREKEKKRSKSKPLNRFLTMKILLLCNILYFDDLKPSLLFLSLWYTSKNERMQTFTFQFDSLHANRVRFTSCSANIIHTFPFYSRFFSGANLHSYSSTITEY